MELTACQGEVMLDEALTSFTVRDASLTLRVNGVTKYAQNIYYKWIIL